MSTSFTSTRTCSSESQWRDAVLSPILSVILHLDPQDPNKVLINFITEDGDFRAYKGLASSMDSALRGRYPVYLDSIPYFRLPLSRNLFSSIEFNLQGCPYICKMIPRNPEIPPVEGKIQDMKAFVETCALGH